MNIPKLTHTDLIDIGRKKYSYKLPEILLPDEIPVYRGILSHMFAYTRDFLSDVVKTIPEMIEEDIIAIKEKLNKEIEVEIRPDRICDNQGLWDVRFDTVTYIIRPSVPQTGIDYGTSSGLWIEPKKEYTIWLENHPFPENIAKAYAVKEEDGGLEFYFWRTHNIHDFGFASELFARNFSIAFNNMGIDRL